MSRFKSLDDVSAVQAHHKNVPFTNVYGCVEEDWVYINMEAVSGLQKNMTTQRDMYVVVDISGSMREHYRESGFFSKKRSAMERMLTTIIDNIAPFDDDGVDVLFFSSGHVLSGNISSASEVDGLLHQAMNHYGAFGSTMPTQSFSAITAQMREKHRPATVFFLTDGAMDDGGKELQNFYRNVLHKEFRTRDQFYCFAIEFGHDARDALEVLNGLYGPEQGPEDLFDVENANNLDVISNVLRQVGGMSAIGSSDQMVATVTNGALIDMVNTDLIGNGQSTVGGEINQIMSFRVKANTPFELTIKVNGYDDMKIQCRPQGLRVDVNVA